MNTRTRKAGQATRASRGYLTLLGIACLCGSFAVWCYQPPKAYAAGWSAGADSPTVIVRSAGVFFPANGKFYSVGGRTSDAAASDFQHVLEFTGPDAPGSWTQKSVTLSDNFTSNMACGVLTVSSTPRIYCVGGSFATGTTATARVFFYDPVADSATTLAAGDNWPGDAAGTILPGGFAVANNKLYIIGGFNINVASTNQIWEFDPTAGVGSKWTQKVNAPEGVMFAPATTIGGIIYVGGASDFQGGTVVDTTNSFSFNPTANSIGAIAAIPRATGETRAVTFGGKMFVLGGGRVPPNPSTEVDIYDPVGNSWSTGTAFTTPRRNFPADTDGTRIFIVGGYASDGITPLSSMEIFTSGAPTPTPTPTPTTPPTVAANGTTLDAVEGQPFTNKLVATFTSSNPALPASNFTATINWGDGTAFSSGTITSNGGGSFNVTGSHTYAEEGSYNIAVTIHDTANNFDATANTAATVADAPLSVGNLSPGSPTQFSGVGGTNTAGGALTAFNAFKTAVGGVDHGATASPQVGGFRTINWDAVALDGTDFGGDTTVIVPNETVGIPVNRFQERGTEFEEVYAVSGDGFVSVNPNAAGQFPAFSPTKTFAMFNDNTIGFSFVLPSAHSTTPVQAASRGFGAIFLDVETPNATSIEYFNGTTSLGKFFVPVGASAQPEFFGVLFQNPVVTHVQIVLGNAQLFSFDGTTVTPGDADNPPASDLAVTDDFVYAEPTAVPTGINITASVGDSVNATVASFKDADPMGQLSDFTAIINWGDGTTSSGTITPNADGGFDVTGSHTYFTAGVFSVTTSIRDIGGSSISAVSTAIIGGQSVLGSIQFSAATTSASESAGSATINVTRTGDTSVPASVNFETSDGSAHQRSDYTFNSGTVQFAPGETSKQIKVLLVNDAFVEGSETFFVTLSNPSSNFMLGSPGTIAVTITDDDTVATTVNPIDDTNFFVRQQYLDFLGREPDSSGFNFWTGQINACGSNATCVGNARVNTSAAFFLSIEFQETGGNVIRTQRVAFGRQSADPASRVPYLQFMRDTRQVGAGVVVGQPGFDTLLEANKQAYAQQLVTSAAFLARFPITPAAEYVDALYASAAVTPTSSERQAAINAFGAGGTAGRVAALRSVADSNSVRQAELNPSFVLAEYFGYLRRNPTDAPDFNDAGYQFWLAKLVQFNGDFNKAEMVKAFIVSQEYRGRFGQP